VRQLVKAVARRRVRQGQRPAHGGERPRVTHESGCCAAASAAPSLINRPRRSGVRRASASRREPTPRCSVAGAPAALAPVQCTRSPRCSVRTASESIVATALRRNCTAAAQRAAKASPRGRRALALIVSANLVISAMSAQGRGQRCDIAVMRGRSGDAGAPCVFGSTPAPRSSAKISASETPSCTDTSPLRDTAAPTLTFAQPAQAQATAPERRPRRVLLHTVRESAVPRRHGRQHPQPVRARRASLSLASSTAGGPSPRLGDIIEQVLSQRQRRFAKVKLHAVKNTLLTRGRNGCTGS
jgi:hypothetical protein